MCVCGQGSFFNAPSKKNEGPPHRLLGLLCFLEEFPQENVRDVLLAALVPKGPFRTKNTTTIAKIVKFLRRSVFYYPPHIYYAGDPSLR